MFDHVTIRASDVEASERFYATVLATLGIEPTHRGEDLIEWDDFSIVPADAASPATRRLHIGFVAPSRAHADAFWHAGTEAGHRDDGAPGPRPEYGDDYYGAFLLDPDGNSVEAVHHAGMSADGNIDHVWIRVADVAAAKRFYETVAPYARLHAGMDTPERVRFERDGGSLSLLAGNPTAHLHIAFPATDNATVDAFHRTATAAGYRDNGPPGGRPEYHAGYYGAFVCDPDGNNVELVNHNRP